TTVKLHEVVSSEPDDAPGMGDGETAGDIAGADSGAADSEILLRAERSGEGPGRVYTLTYEASDQSGNAIRVSRQVLVPHDAVGGSEPLQLRLEPEGTSGKARVSWDSVADASGYDLIRGNLSGVLP